MWSWGWAGSWRGGLGVWCVEGWGKEEAGLVVGGAEARRRAGEVEVGFFSLALLRLSTVEKLWTPYEIYLKLYSRSSFSDFFHTCNPIPNHRMTKHPPPTFAQRRVCAWFGGRSIYGRDVGQHSYMTII